MALVEYLLDPQVLAKLVTAAIEIVFKLASAIEEASNELASAALTLIVDLIAYLLDPQRQLELLQAGVDIVMNLLGGFTSKNGEVEAAADGMASKIISSLINADWLQATEDVVNDILSGFVSAWESVVGWFDVAKGGLLSGTDEVRAGWSDLSRWVDNEK